MLSVLVKNSLRTGKIPRDWRRTNFLHMCKKQGTENCKPVSLISVQCKVFEQIKERVNKHLDSKAVMNNSQYGLVTINNGGLL